MLTKLNHLHISLTIYCSAVKLYAFRFDFNMTMFSFLISLEDKRSLEKNGVFPKNIRKQVFTSPSKVLYDSPPYNKNFGDCIKQPPSRVFIGDEISVKFIAGHPRNNLYTEQSYFKIEMLIRNDTWKIVATDANWETKFLWQAKLSLFFGTGEIEVQWKVTDNYSEGTYRIRHFGTSKNFFHGGLSNYVGKSKSFDVVGRNQ